jgi:hypothetical protein
VLVREAGEQGVSLNHYLTEIVCSRARQTATVFHSKVARRESKPKIVNRRSTARPT